MTVIKKQQSTLRGIKASIRYLVMSIVCLLPFTSNMQAAGFAAVEIKAVYLLNFTNFIHWPEDAFDDSTTPFNYCLFNGANSIAEPLAEVLQGETVGKRSVQFKTISSIAAIKACQILYIGNDEKLNLKSILLELAGQPILSVSDIDGFAARGGGIEFATKAGRIKLLINVAKVDDARLSISSKLLRVADLLNAGTTSGESW